MFSNLQLSSRFKGGLMGLAVGDALGTTVEFMKSGFAPLTDIVGGGKFNLLPGQWTDDTSMALCLCNSLILNKGAFDPSDQLRAYLKWYREGHLSSNGQCFDIGITVRTAVLEFEKSETKTAVDDQTRAGNGSLMRLISVPLLYYKNPALAIELAGKSSKTTHGSQVSADACRYFAGLIVGILQGAKMEEILSPKYCPIPGYWDTHPLAPEIEEIANGSFKKIKEPATSGYVVHTLEAVLWAFYHSSNFQDGCLKLVNLGGDADTTGAIYGQLAGTFYGIESIPLGWTGKRLILNMAGELEALSNQVFSESGFDGEGYPSQEYLNIWESFTSMEAVHAKILRKVLPGPHAYKSITEFEEHIAELREEYFKDVPKGDSWKQIFWTELEKTLTQEKEQVQQRTSRRPVLPFAFAKK